MRSHFLFLLSPVLGILLSCSSPTNEPAHDQWKVINYWAIWCKPCREEIPELNRLDSDEKLTVLGVNFDGKTGSALAADANNLGIQFKNIPDPSEKLNLKRPNVLPTTFIVSPEGSVKAVLVGPQTEDSILAVILD